MDAVDVEIVVIAHPDETLATKAIKETALAQGILGHPESLGQEELTHSEHFCVVGDPNVIHCVNVDVVHTLQSVFVELELIWSHCLLLIDWAGHYLQLGHAESLSSSEWLGPWPTIH